MNTVQHSNRRLNMNRWMAAVAVVALAAGGGPAWAGVKVGEPAPAFTATDTNGQARSLGEFTGKFVVLEWFNNECPFVKKHYGAGNMQKLQADWTGKGVTWLTIASSAPEKQGHMTAAQANEVVKARGARQTALLLDPDGAVGKLYGAKTTPHMFIVDPDGRLIYAGAIDNVASPDPNDIAGANNYVDQALKEATAGKPVSVAETQSYGCSVKY
jgi:peroxiredoxin